MSKTVEAEKWYKGSHYPLPYDDMITIQETDLFECLTDFANSQHEQLTKERDGLKEQETKDVVNTLALERHIGELKAELKAEKKRVEELTEVLVTISIAHTFENDIEELIDNVLNNE